MAKENFIIEHLNADIFFELKKSIYPLFQELIDNEKKINLKKLEMNYKLAGNLESEFNICNLPIRDILEKEILNLIEKYEIQNPRQNTKRLSKKNKLTLSELWVNFQKKHEFNPIHNHLGVYSFVIWVYIPYDIQKELANGPGKLSNSNKSSIFEFYFLDSFGEIMDYPLYVDKSYEGKICLFPAQTKHAVYPFYTSDDYRISVAGNVFLT